MFNELKLKHSLHKLGEGKPNRLSLFQEASPTCSTVFRACYVLFLQQVVNSCFLAFQVLGQSLFHFRLVISLREQSFYDPILDPGIQAKPVLHHFFHVLVDVLQKLCLQSLPVAHFDKFKKLASHGLLHLPKVLINTVFEDFPKKLQLGVLGCINLDRLHD